MKKILLHSLLLIGGFATAQNEFNCGFLHAQEALFKEDPTAKARTAKLIEDANNISNNNQLKTMATTFTIPVVFHILHLGGNENISDAQVHDAIAVMNRDYSKKNADTTGIIAQYKPIAADCQIEFQLATLDENGNCTNGITRHYTPHTDWVASNSYYTYTWDRTKYLNIYVVRTMQAGAAGYTYLPGQASANADAIVALHSYVGSIGTSNPYTSRTLTHEAGHWFNLQHTWGSTNQPGVACGDDGVSDTPITKGHQSCNLNSAVCTSGIVENVQNYMEYAYCSKMFTQGQKTRMINCINSGIVGRDNLSTNANLIATGVINPNANCAPKADFVADAVTCVGNNYTFTDYSYNATVTNWEWSSPTAAATSTLQNGVLSFTNSGTATVKLKVSNAFGMDSITKQSLIVLPGLNSGSLNTTQGFETTFPDVNWTATIPQYGSSFVLNTTTAATGTNCIWVNNFYDNPNGPVTVYSPLFNLQNVINSPQLTFKYAYAQQAANNNDALKVFVSTNCGGNWTQLYSKSGAQLNTTGTLIPTAYLQPQASEWVTEMISLSGSVGNQKVALKFEFTPNAGNNIFIDDINISGAVNIRENNSILNSVNVFPNPFSNKLVINGNGFEKINTIQMLDVLGKEVTMQIERNADGLQLNIENIASGIYFLRLNSSEGNKVVKVVKE